MELKLEIIRFEKLFFNIQGDQKKSVPRKKLDKTKRYNDRNNVYSGEVAEIY